MKIIEQNEVQLVTFTHAASGKIARASLCVEKGMKQIAYATCADMKALRALLNRATRMGAAVTNL